MDLLVPSGTHVKSKVSVAMKLKSFARPVTGPTSALFATPSLALPRQTTRSLPVRRRKRRIVTSPPDRGNQVLPQPVSSVPAVAHPPFAGFLVDQDSFKLYKPVLPDIKVTEASSFLPS